MKKIISILLLVSFMCSNVYTFYAVDDGEQENQESTQNDTETNTDNLTNEDKQDNEETNSSISEFTADDLPDKYVVIDAVSSEVILSLNEHDKVKAGSMPGVLTSLIMLKDNALDSKIVSPENFTTPEGPSIAVDTNEEFTLEQLLYAILLNSANDASKTIAIHKSGSVEDFTLLLNEKAKELNMNDTKFISPLDIQSEDQITSVYDVAVLLKNAMNYSSFKEIIASESYIIPPTNKKDVDRNYIKQTNLFMLNNGEVMDYMDNTVNIYDAEVKGGKLDVFVDGKYLMYTYVESSQMPLIFVSYGSADSKTAYSKQKALMQKVKEEYTSYNLVVKGSVQGEIQVNPDEELKLNMLASQNISAILPKSIDIEKDIKKTIEKVDLTNKAILKDMKLGELSLTYDGKEIAKIDLVAETGLENESFVGDLSKVEQKMSVIEIFLAILFFIIKIVIIIFLWLFLLIITRGRRKKKNIHNNVSDLNEYKKNKRM